MKDTSSRLALVNSDLVASDGAPSAILAVGELDEWSDKESSLSYGNDMVFVSFDEVSEGCLDAYKPSLVVSPALSPAFDCIELAMLLRNIGYKGAYRAVVRDMPNPDLIEREVKSICPLVDFGILKVD